MDGSLQLWPLTTVAARCTERWCHDHYSNEAAQGPWQAFLDEV
jgi:hypothetical protein